MMKTSDISPANEGEISLLDIIDFATQSWKKLFIAAVIGAALGFSYWYFPGGFMSEITLINNNGTDLVGWRSLQKSLPNLAEQMLDESKIPEGKESLYRILSSPDWWQKNAVATYGMTKAESKDLASTAGLESAGSSIISISLTTIGPNKQTTVGAVREAQNFLLQGASYLAIRTLLNAQEAQVISADAEISKKINSTQLELDYQQQRLKSLEALAKRFPNEQKTTSQVVDPKDSGAKYLPLSTQIIAANTDINTSKELLEKLKDSQAQIVVLKTWVRQATPLIAETFDGLEITKQLLQQEAALRKTIDPADLKSLRFIDDLRSVLLGIDVKYTKGFVVNTAPISGLKKGMLKNAAAGLVLSFMLTLVALLVHKAGARIKEIKRGGGK